MGELPCWPNGEKSFPYILFEHLLLDSMFLVCLVPSSQSYPQRYQGPVVRPPKNCPWGQIRPQASASPYRAIHFQELLITHLSPLNFPQFFSLAMWIYANTVKEVSLYITSGAASGPPQPLTSLSLQFFGKGEANNTHFNPLQWNTEKSSWEKVDVMLSLILAGFDIITSDVSHTFTSGPHVHCTHCCQLLVRLL